MTKLENLYFSSQFLKKLPTHKKNPGKIPYPLQLTKNPSRRDKSLRVAAPSPQHKRVGNQ